MAGIEQRAALPWGGVAVVDVFFTLFSKAEFCPEYRVHVVSFDYIHRTAHLDAQTKGTSYTSTEDYNTIARITKSV